MCDLRSPRFPRVVENVTADGALLALVEDSSFDQFDAGRGWTVRKWTSSGGDIVATHTMGRVSDLASVLMDKLVGAVIERALLSGLSKEETRAVLGHLEYEAVIARDSSPLDDARMLPPGIQVSACGITARGSQDDLTAVMVIHRESSSVLVSLSNSNL